MLRRSVEGTSVKVDGESFARRGFAIIRNFVSSVELAALSDELDAWTTGRGRGFLDADGPVARFASSQSVLTTMRSVIGADAHAVRSFALDKSAANNWSLAWHQDTTIAVRERKDAVGFAGWSVKDGGVHVQAPPYILENMASLRIHIDDAPEEAGPLLLASGTHGFGFIGGGAIGGYVRDADIVTCVCCRGDAILARPLLLHSSARSRISARRRILHIEFAGLSLPLPLEWHPF